MPSRQFSPNPSPKHRTTSVVFLAITALAAIVIIIAVLYFVYYLWYSLVHRSRTIPFDSGAGTLVKLHRFSYRELKSATSDFSDENSIGKGGSGTVFRGILRDGKLVAVKMLDSSSLQAEKEFQNELQVLSGLKSPFIVSLLGYCVEKKSRMLVYEYMPNRSLQESLFSPTNLNLNLSWGTRFDIILDIARGLSVLHLECDPPVVHGDVKPSNVLLDSEFGAKLSDFGLSRVKTEGEFVGVEMFSQELCKSQELSGNLAETPEVDFSLALKNSGISHTRNTKGKEVFDDEVPTSVEHSKELNLNPNAGLFVDDAMSSSKHWWWRQDDSGELCTSKDYVMEWIGNQISPLANSDWDEEKKTSHSTPLEKLEAINEGPKPKPALENNNKHRKMQEWWKEENLINEIGKKKRSSKLKSFKSKCKKAAKVSHFHLGRRRQNKKPGLQHMDFSFQMAGKEKKNARSVGSEMWSGDLLSSTTSMRGTLCYVAPEYGGCGYLMEKADIYSFGVLVLVIVSGRRPLHVLSSPMKLEKANLISWCRQLAHSGNILELVDEKLKDEYNSDQASLCINLALACLQRMPELRPNIGEIVKILKGEMDLSPNPFEFSPSPPSKLFSRSRQKQKAYAE